MSYSDNPFIPQMMSPAAYEIGRYGRTPASHFYGLPNISIPLTEVRAKDYSLPISLSYHAGGHKPELHPGWVGLGWSLNTGGSIVRVVNGMKDEMSSQEYGSLTERYDDSPGYLNRIDEVQIDTNWNDDSAIVAKALPWLEYEPDEYIIKAPGIHASFYITGKNKITVVSRDESAIELEKIELADDSESPLDMYPGKCNKPVIANRYVYIKTFIIRDKYGNRYVFGGNDSAIEYSVVQYPNIEINNNAYINTGIWKAIATANSWMLTRIERTDGEIITFEYEKNGVPIVLRDIHHGETFVCDNISELNYSSDTYSQMLAGNKSNLNFHFLLPSYLKKINCLLSGDELSFVTANSTELKYNISENDFNTWVFQYHNQRSTVGPITFFQFQSEDRYRKLTQITGTNRNINFEYTNSLSTRLKLTAISLKNSDAEYARYAFSYNSTNLPAYNSRMTDIWGYYNGISYADLLGGAGSGLSDRRKASQAAMKAEILTQITYPTGGYTLFEYEAHKYSKKCFPMDFTLAQTSAEGIAGGLRIKSITDCASSSAAPQTRTFEYVEGGISSGILTADGECKKEGRFTFNHQIQPYSGSFMLYSELPLLPLSETDGCQVTYSFVRERYPDGSYIDYRYTNSDDSSYKDAPPRNEVGRSSGCPLYPQFTSRSLYRGQLKERRTYRSDGSIVLSETMTYGTIGTSSYFKSMSQHRYIGGRINFAAYIMHPCDYPALTKKSVTQYLDDGSSITDIYEYSYNNQRLIESIRQSRNGENSEEITYYPKDRSGYIYTMMKTAGMHGVTVGKVNLRNSGVIKCSEISFLDMKLSEDRQLIVPEKTFSTALSTPVTLNDYTASPMMCLNPTPDIHVKSWDSSGNVKFVGLRNGSAMEHHWTTKTGKPGMRLKTFDLPPAEHISHIENIRLTLGTTIHYTASFKTTEPTDLSVILGADYNYAWYICIQLDGTYRYLANWAIPTTPDFNWTTRVNLYGNTLNMTVPAGNHNLSIYHIDWEGPGGSADASGGTIQCTYADSAKFEDISTFVDLDINTESGEGFHCEQGHVGPLIVSHPVTSGKVYILDYMLKNGSSWQYIKTTYTGGSKLIGTLGQTISNVRIYPEDSMVDSFCWRKYSGMSAVLDSHGVAQSYTYDGAGRLSEVRDNSSCKVYGYLYSFGNGANVTINEFTNISGGSKRSIINHYDGLGRIEQNIIVDGSPSGADVVTFHEYDNMDREVRTWLPTPMSLAEGDVATLGNISSAAKSFYGGTTSDEVAQSLSVYDASPQGRLLKEYGPGKAWRNADKSVRRELMANGTSASNPTYHRGFNISWSGTSLSLTRNAGATSAGSLLIEKTIDEDGRTRLDFINMHGETVLSRSIMNDGSWNDTHFIYDAFGRISAILPPKLTSQLESSLVASWAETDISLLAYLYRYDNKGNCIAKLLPGGGWTYFIYDKGDRLIFTQDATQRGESKWTFRLEDIFGRECIIGTTVLIKDVFSDPLALSNVYVIMPSSPVYTGTLKGYEVTGSPLGSNIEILKVNYYDNYGFLGTYPFPVASNESVVYDSSAGSEFGSRYALSEKGLLTGSLIKILDSSNDATYMWSVAYYDDKGRPVQTRELMCIGGVRKEYYGYDFIGNITKRKTIQAPTTGEATTVIQTFTYDAMGRPLKTMHQVGTGPQTAISDKIYDEVGRLIKNLKTGLTQLKEERHYNIRSWLTKISGDMFTEDLSYENSSAPQWGGNISSIGWSTSSVQKQYIFGYDALSRLVSASFYSGESQSLLHSESYTYDQNGNINSLTRAGQTQALNHSGNRLVNVGNAGFVYDAKGRQISSEYGMTVATQYNIIDLPQKHIIGDGSTVVDYKYAADGRKLQECVVTGSLQFRRDYVDDFIYEAGHLKRILFDGGYVDVSGSTKTYMFFTKDHLGSVRAVVSQMGTVQQTNEYYPFGDQFATSDTDASGNRFKFTGKELGTETGLYDFSARFMQPTFGRFTTIDPLAEKYPGISPYAYCAGNPVNFVDPDGMDWYAYYLGRQDSYENMLPYMSYVWTDAKSQEELDALGIQGAYMGEAVVVFDGYYDERLGKDGTLTGKDAKPANVTVYGPRGADDIENYIGYTMSSDSSQFGVIANGQYEVQRDYPGPYGSVWAINKRGKVPALNGFNPAYPDRCPGYLEKTLIHRNNSDGFTGTRYSYKEKRMVNISEGCLIINYDKWDRFNATFENVSKFLLVLNRE